MDLLAEWRRKRAGPQWERRQVVERSGGSLLQEENKDGVLIVKVRFPSIGVFFIKIGQFGDFSNVADLTELNILASKVRTQFSGPKSQTKRLGKHLCAFAGPLWQIVAAITKAKAA